MIEARFRRLEWLAPWEPVPDEGKDGFEVNFVVNWVQVIRWRIYLSRQSVGVVTTTMFYSWWPLRNQNLQLFI